MEELDVRLRAKMQRFRQQQTEYVTKVISDVLYEKCNMQWQKAKEEEEAQKSENRRRRPWVRKWINHRSILGGEVLLRELEEDPKSFKNALRMTSDMFDELLRMIEDKIQKQDTQLRQALSAQLKLEVTLRYLATGDSLKSLSYFFRLPPSSTYIFFPSRCTSCDPCSVGFKCESPEH